MPNPLVECIPNFSEARRPEVVEAIIQAITQVPGVHILDRHSDMDHNRTVITFIGSPAAVEQAAFQSIARASQLIDLTHHTGEHPRIGAADVVPFVPISDITMQECVEMARRLGKRVADELKVPVYLYEDAATRPERQNLENIRRGQYEGLKADILTNPDRKPDFGPAELGPAGATVIGARQPLIAFNAYLTTDDVSIAQKIAKAIRNSSGGLRFIKAMGVLVEGRAQVSMNLTNFRQTPIARVVELVRREAVRYGVGIHHTELVGLIPQEALNDAAVWYTQLDAFQTDQILEQRLYEVLSEPKAETPPAGSSFLDELAAGTPTPGGGSAAAHAGAIGAALAAMVARLTVGKKKYANVEQRMWLLIEKSDALRQTLTLAIDEDALAFTCLMQATRLPKETEEQQAARKLAIQQATLEAARVPLKVANLAVDVMRLTLEAARFGNLNAISDAASGFSMARACLNGAGLNVRINLQGLEDPTSGQPMLNELTRLEKTARDLVFELRRALAERSDMTLPD